MYRPNLISKSDVSVITLADVKSALRIETADFDADIERLINAAIDYYEGWSGVLGICVGEQTWQQEFCGFEKILHLPLGPVQSLNSVKYRTSQGIIETVAPGNYALRRDASGRSHVRFIDNFAAPSGLYEDAPVSVEYVAGWPSVEGKSSAPDDIRTAMTLFIQKHFDEAARSSWDILDRAEKSLISKYRMPLV